MSLADPQPAAEHLKSPAADHQILDMQKPSQRSQLPESPGPVCTDESYDDAMLDDYYSEIQAPKKSRNADQPPALPERSALRASRLLDGFTLKLGPEPAADLPHSTTTPHDMYLSSEEDASSSADDFSDDEFESDSEASQGSPVIGRSHEDIARIVSVVFAGKPSLVQLPMPRRSISPNSIEQRRRSILASSTTDSTDSRRVSISSVSTTFTNSAHPPRSSSIVSAILPKQRPSFLSIDPFAGKTYQEKAEEETRGEHDTPKTPSGVWKRTLSLVKKRSRPTMHTNFSTVSRDNLTSPSVQTLPLDNTITEEDAPKMSMDPQTPVTYNEIMRAARKNAQTTAPAPPSPVAQSPMSPVGARSRLLGGLSMNRRRSVKV